MGRRSWKGEGGLISKVEYAGKERIGKGGWRKDGRLQSHIEIARTERMLREGVTERGLKY